MVANPHVRHKKPIIGLCGGIGAGKSRVAAEFERLGCLIIDSDRTNHEVLRQPAILAEIRQWWGPEVVAPDGMPNRARIAEIIFTDPAARGRLESLVHPLIKQAHRDMIRAVEDNQAVTAIVIDSPLLLESHLDRECDTIVYVNASEAQRVRRLVQERGWDAQELKRRERWQISPDEKRSRADYVIDNDGAAEHLRPQVAAILQSVLARHS